jgi:hypothetical protein
MTAKTTEQFETELRSAITDSRSSTTLSAQGAAERRIQRVLSAADKAGVDLYRTFFAIDEEIRVSIHGK